MVLGLRRVVQKVYVRFQESWYVRVYYISIVNFFAALKIFFGNQFTTLLREIMMITMLTMSIESPARHISLLINKVTSSSYRFLRTNGF